MKCQHGKKKLFESEIYQKTVKYEIIKNSRFICKVLKFKKNIVEYCDENNEVLTQNT